jgi:cytidylate kinase
MNVSAGKIVTIDGPAGAGKSTVGKLLAERLKYDYLDTGALYRALAFKAAEFEEREDIELRIPELVKNLNISIRCIQGQTRIYINEQDVTDQIRTPEIGMLASKISAYPSVRSALLSIQRELGKKGGIVADGRDMGTVVFPEADFKFYLDAVDSERSKRRYLELKQKNTEIDLNNVHKDMKLRDKQDMEREAAPLRPAQDAIIIDSTSMGINEVVERMLKMIKKCSTELSEKV